MFSDNVSINYSPSPEPPATKVRLCLLRNGSLDLSENSRFPKPSPLMPVEKKTDRRVQKSLQALQDALLELMLEKGYGETSVSDIVERANVGRSTFYAHFADKEDLLQQSLQGLRGFLTDETIPLPERKGPSHPALTFALPLFMHAEERMDLFRSLMRAGSGAPVQEHLQIMLTDLVKDVLGKDATKQTPSDISNALKAEFIVGSFLAVLLAWLADPGTDTPSEIEAKFRRMVLGGPLSPHPSDERPTSDRGRARRDKRSH